MRLPEGFSTCAPLEAAPFLTFHRLRGKVRKGVASDGTYPITLIPHIRIFMVYWEKGTL